MEALPVMPVICLRFRESVVDYMNGQGGDFKMRVKEYILMHFQSDPHVYDEAFRDLYEMKFLANCPSVNVETSLKLKRYYGQLCMMQKRFPMSQGQELEFPYSWYDSFSESRQDHTDLSISDIEFEKASVMFNIGSCHAQIAMLESREDQDSIKNAFMHYQYAAFAFQKLSEQRYDDAFYPSIDLDPQMLKFLQKLMLAQAQECLVQKSLIDNRSSIVIAKLSKWLVEAYEEMTKLVEEWNMNISDKIHKGFLFHLRVKAQAYGAITYLSMGNKCEEEQKMGPRLGYYNIAMKYVSIYMKEKNLDKTDFVASIMFLSDVVEAKQVNAEKENNFIYHERVPKEEELLEELKDGSMCKVKALSFDPLDRSVCGDDIFGSLLPPAVLQSVSLYEEKKAELKRNVLAEMRKADEELETFLNKVNYHELHWMLKEGKDSDRLFAIPDQLLERNAIMTSQPDAIPSLLEKLREQLDTSRISEARLSTLMSKLGAIDHPKIKNDEGYGLISKELEKLGEHLKLAKSNTVSLNKALAECSTHLQKLSLPFEELKSQLVPVDSAMKKPQKMSKEEAQLLHIIDKIEEMTKQRKTLIDQLDKELNQDDISKELLANRDFAPDSLFEKEIKKHDETIKYLRFNRTAQENITQAFTEANADYCDERVEINELREEFDKKIRILIEAYETYKDVLQKSEEGEKFYRQLMQRCDQFSIPIHAMEEQYRGEIEKQEREKREHEERMLAIRRQKEAREAMAEFGMPHQPPPMMAQPPMPAVSTTGPRLKDVMEQYRSRKGSSNSYVPPVVPPPAAPSNSGPSVPPSGPPSPAPSSVNEFAVNTNIRNVPQNPPMFPPSYAPSSFQMPPRKEISGYHSPAPPNETPILHSSTQPPVHKYASEQETRMNPVNGARNSPLVGGQPQMPSMRTSSSSTPVNYPQGQPQSPAFHLNQSIGYQQANQHYQQPPSASQMNIQPNNFTGNQAQPPAPLQMSQSNSSFGSMNSLNGHLQPSQHHHHQMNQVNQYPAPSRNCPPVMQANQMNASSGQHHPSHLPPNQSNNVSMNYGSHNPSLSTPQTQPNAALMGGTYNSFHQPHVPPQQISQPGLPANQSNSSLASMNFGPQKPPTEHSNVVPNPVAAATPPIPQQPSTPTTGANPTMTSSSSSLPGFASYSTQRNSPWHSGPSKASPWHSSGLPPNSAIGTPSQPISTNPMNQLQTPPAFQVNQQFPTTNAVPNQNVQQNSTPMMQNQGGFQQSSVNNSSQNNAPVGHPPQPQQQQQQQQQPQSNVDLLSSIFDNLNLPPALTPTEHTTQNAQNQRQADQPQTNQYQNQQKSIPAQDFRPTDSHPAPDKRDNLRPAVAVMPMPQQNNLRTNVSSIATSPMEEPPVLSMSHTTSVSYESENREKCMEKSQLGVRDIMDPKKFVIGEGDARKLEKRMLHNSIRTQSVLPPLDPNDPINQIDVMGILRKP